MIKLVYHNNPGDFSPWLKPWWRRTFDIEAWQPGKTYDPAGTIIWTDYLGDNSWADAYADFKTVRNYQWDTYEDETNTEENNILHFRPRYWVWISEYLTYKYLSYDQKLQPNCPNHFLLLLMNLRRGLRDYLLSRVAPYRNDSLVSYVGQGIRLAGDLEPDQGLFQRHFNPNWYASTCFSLVSETMTDNRLYVSEKSFKPMAYKHPAIIYGTPGNLKYLNDQGFKTFEHCVDESYDTIIDPIERLHAILKQVDRLYQEYKQGHCPFQDAETQARLEHNYHTFYNAERVEHMWRRDIVEPIEEWFNA